MAKRQGKVLKNASQAAALTQDEITQINAGRSPSERIQMVDMRCGAKVRPRSPSQAPRQSDSPYCLNRAGEGTSHPGYGNCKFHGGSTPAGNKKAARDFGHELIRVQKEKFGGDHQDLTITAEEALLEEVRRSVAMVRWLEGRIGTWRYGEDYAVLDPATGALTIVDVDDPLGGLPQLVDETSRGASSFTDEREWLMLYREERAHAARVSKMAIDAGLAERMVRIAENQGKMLALAIKAVLAALGLTPDQERLIPQIVPPILRQITQGQPVTQEAKVS